MGYYWDGGNPPEEKNTMSDCEKMQMFIDDNYAMEYIIWETAILNQLNKNDNGTTDITDTDFDIID